MLHTSTGIIRYARETSYNVRVVIEPDIIRYYRSLVPRWIKTNPQAYPAHVSVVRKETPPNLEFWEKYEGDEVEFQYDGVIRFSEVYVWLNVFSKRLEDIRLELGLPVHGIYTEPPLGFSKVFHTTLGNFKELK